VEIIISLEVVFDAVEIDQDIVKLLKEEEAAGHALPAWNSIAFSC
jgi:hypothetical protein